MTNQLNCCCFVQGVFFFIHIENSILRVVRINRFGFFLQTQLNSGVNFPFHEGGKVVSKDFFSYLGVGGLYFVPCETLAPALLSKCARVSPQNKPLIFFLPIQHFNATVFTISTLPSNGQKKALNIDNFNITLNTN